ncbi:MAG: tetratricopeptide repeat protein [Cyanobacteria bacterium]|nr:tetratricopeptide repeat protein [Cyanobacteriota bacterium]
MRQPFPKQVFTPKCIGTSFRILTTSLLALSFFLQYPTALAEMPFFKKMAPKEVPLRLSAPEFQGSTVPAGPTQSTSTRRPVSAIADESSASSNTPRFQEGVKLYREGQYSKAYPQFEKEHQENPADLNNTYYLAITAAQLGRFKQAKAYYDEINLLDPQSKASQ